MERGVYYVSQNKYSETKAQLFLELKAAIQ